jgi:hypothetical protein
MAAHASSSDRGSVCPRRQDGSDGTSERGRANGSQRSHICPTAKVPFVKLLPFVKLRTVAVFAVGYVLGSKAGRERYAQIVAAAHQASKRLENYSRNRGEYVESPPTRADSR